MKGNDAPRPKRLAIAACRVSALAVVLLAATASAQIPDKFENLKVLPEDIEKSQLVDVMKSFCGALAVRCVYCHVGEENAPLSEVDFVSDENEHKADTRVMMRMVDDINKTQLPKLGPGHPKLEVRCVTCHHGQTKPRTLEQVLARSLAKDGLEDAVAQYRELRAKHYGSATFDFTAGTLANLATQLAGEEKSDAAIAFLELNVELYPDDATSYYYLGDLYAKGGDKAKGIQSLEKALALQPRNPAVQRRLAELKGI